MSRFLKTMALAVGVSVAVGSIAQAETKHKVFLSMSYIGNDWQAEATNMVKALALSKDFVNKVDLQVQVAGPSAQRQIQQINAMVQAGAEAIVVYPISPTALNQVVKNACDKGVKIFAYEFGYHRALRLQRWDRPSRRRPTLRAVAGRSVAWQGQRRDGDGRAGHLR